MVSHGMSTTMERSSRRISAADGSLKSNRDASEAATTASSLFTLTSCVPVLSLAEAAEGEGKAEVEERAGVEAEVEVDDAEEAEAEVEAVTGNC